MKSSPKHETEEITPQVIKGEDVAKQYDWEKKFKHNFRGWKIHHKTSPCIKDSSAIQDIKDFIQELVDAERVEAYKQGVHDEIECIETSGEHGEAVEKIRAQERERVRAEIISADSVISFLHYRGYIHYNKKGCPTEDEINQLIGRLRALSSLDKPLQVDKE